MINTIFYFTDTELEYLDTYAYGQVKPHTICFAKDTKSIWRDGLRFSGLRKDEVDLIIDEDVKPLIDALEAALNLANQLAIDRDNQLTEDLHDLEDAVAAVDGRITTEKNRLDGRIDSLDTEIDGVALDLIDTAAEIQGKLDRGEVAYNSGWNENVKAYMQTVGLWDYGESSSIVTKWSQLRQSVNNVSSEVNRVETKADGYNTTLNSKINQEITDRGTAITNLSNTFANTTDDLQDVIEWMYSGLHSGAAQDMSYAEIIAAGKNGASSAISDLRTSIETTSDGKYVAQSSLTSSVDNAISGIVNAAAGTYANTQLFAKIDLNGSNIASLTADVTELDLSIQGIASNPNLTATFLAKTDFNTAKAALEAADTQNANAIGQVQTQVTRLDGGPEVTNSVAAKVNSAISTFEQKVNNGQACTVLVNKVDATSEDLVALTQYIDPDQAYSTIGAKIAASEAGVITLVKDDLATAGILSKNGNNYTSAVYTKTETNDAIDSATAGLMAANDFTSASVVAKVNDAGSGIAINADKIKIDANHQLDLSAQTITVNADDINLVGQTHFESAIGDMITTKSLKISDVNNLITTIIESGNATFSGDVKASTLTAGPEQGMHIVTTGNEIHFINGDTIMGKFVTEDDGLQMYILGPDGDLYKVNFNNWTNTSGGGTSSTYKLYRFTQSGSSSFSNITNHTSVYGNGDDIYYSDQSGKHLANLGSSSQTNAFLEWVGVRYSVILPNIQSVPGITNVMYHVDVYRDVYFVDGTKHYGPNQYAITKSGTTDRIYFVKSSTSTSGVYAYNVYTSESAGSTSCADITLLNFGSGDVYYATTTISLTPYGSGHMTGVQDGQYSGTLVTY